MEFQFGDVVMFMGRPHFIIGTNDNNDTLVVLDGDSTTFGVDYEDVVKIGHDDTFEQNILDRLKSVVKKHDQELLGNQEQLIGRLKCVYLRNDGKQYTVTGNTKVDGNYLYCQVHSDNGYEWILMEQLWDKFFR